jgi:hypothetical protein
MLLCGSISHAFRRYTSSVLFLTIRNKNLQPDFLRLIGFHSSITVETLLLRLAIEGHYFNSKNTLLRDAFTSVKNPRKWRQYVVGNVGLK